MIDLRLGDCLAELPGLADASVDVTITDPPFDQRTHRTCLESAPRGGKRRIGGELPFPPLDPDRLDIVAAQLARVTRRWIVLFSADRQVESWASALERAGARYVRLGFAVRTNPRPQMTGDRPGQAADPIVIAHGGTGRMRWNGGGRPARWDVPPVRFDAGGQVHPTQKPLSLMRALVEAFTDPAELILDPFAGVGTTAVVARQTGRQFLGWEIHPIYHARALARVADAREQLALGWGHG